EAGEGPVLGARLEMSALRRDGTEFPVELSIARVGTDSPPVFTGFIRDLSEKKRAEEALRTQEARFRTLIENSGDAISITSVDGTIVYMGPSIKRMLGYEPEELVGKNAFETIVHPDEIDARREDLKRLVDDLSRRDPILLRLKHKDGTFRWIESDAVNLL